MRETITMTSRDLRVAATRTRLVAGELSVPEVAVLLGRSERSVWRLRQRYRAEGVDGLVHGNRRRPSPRRIDEPTRDRIRALARGRYDGANDSHLAELLAETEGIAISRVSDGGSCGRPGSPLPGAAGHPATGVAAIECPRRACSCRPTVRAMTGELGCLE
jgi:transposase